MLEKRNVEKKILGKKCNVWKKQVSENSKCWGKLNIRKVNINEE
ncbi:12504_t:CDS:2 [Dentiscutata erythropus]|uniref:12504_t:CDS:1 n=1 Tax=Dentiscutata erythropus TaxID=1348616 RepID=A0A9N9H1M4_9GLOM|nr:12504_t:CDS:2 [Dentiscutata erythropus]